MPDYDMRRKLLELFGERLDPAHYIEKIWNKPYRWQEVVLDPTYKRVMLNCARQSGKSAIVSGVGEHQAKHNPGSLNIIVSPSEKQSRETLLKVKEFVEGDKDLKMIGDSAERVELSNGSRIISLPGTEKAVRGYSKPDTVILDEASKIPDETYKAVRPMLTGAPDAKLILLSTPWNKTGFFYNEWTHNSVWKKILVKVRWDLNEDTLELEERMSEEEFRAYWKARGIDAYYSPRHDLAWLYEELASIGPIWFRREYGCEFLEGMETMFDMDLIESAYSEDIETKYTPDDIYEDIEVFDFGGLV